ncbi:hypothetical protein V5799_024804 [Amblyomma americanum]|uniref:Uncharacterized protein n=1 Tax=Amblyomma americanum TaxID=6943 RepID=A0AAQ4EBI3_AMBAM
MWPPTSGLHAKVDTCSPEDVDTLLKPLASGSNVISAWIECDNPVEDAVVERLVDAISKTKSLRKLHLLLDLSETSIVNVLRSLEQNRSVHRLEISKTTFRRRSVRALARLVAVNRTLNSLSLCLEQGTDSFTQHLAICGELKEAVPSNRFLTDLIVELRGVNRATDFVIKEALRRNRALVNEAVNFVKGSSNRKDAVAFEALQYSWTVQLMFPR